MQAENEKRDDTDVNEEDGGEMDFKEVAEQMAGDDLTRSQEPQPELDLPDEINLDGSGSDMDGDGERDGEGDLAQERSVELDINGITDIMDAGELSRWNAMLSHTATASVVSGRASSQVY